jgi:hypothetical protein
MDYRLTAHAITKIKQAEDPEVLRQQVMLAAAQPKVRYESRKGAGVSFRHIRDGIVAVVSPAGLVITFYIDQEETPLRPDQTDADALRHAAKVARAARDAKRNMRRDRDRAATFAMKGKKS